MSLRYKGNSIFFLSTTAVRLRLCSLVTVAKNRGAKFRENQLLSCKICHKYTYHCTSSVSNMIDQLGWQDLETQRQNFRLSLLFKITHDQTCIPLSDIPSQHHPPQQQDLILTIYQYHLLELIPTSFLLGRTLATSGIICQLGYIKEVTSIDTFKNLISNQ